MSDQFNPEMLQLARELRDWTQSELAKRSGLTQGYLSKLEHGAQEAAPEKIGALAKTLGFPITFFYQQADYTGLGLSVFFYRKRASAQVGHLRRLQAEANFRRICIRRLMRGLEIRTKNTFVAMDVDEHDGNAEKVAQMLRASWALPLGPIRNLVTCIESAGGIVFKFSFGTQDIDAFSLWPDDFSPLFFINSDASADRIRFSLAHELGHVIMHKSASETMEDEANRFASEFLMPANEIGPQLGEMTLAKAGAMKPHWRVSMQSLIRRARDLHKIPESEYTKLFRRMSQLRYRKSEPSPISSEEPAFVARLLEVYRVSNGYSLSDLASLSCVYDEDFSFRYMKTSGLRIAN